MTKKEWNQKELKEFENIIKENLSWLGLNWDKTFNQSNKSSSRSNY